MRNYREKILGLIKYQRQKSLDPQNIHEKKFETHTRDKMSSSRRHDGMMAQDPRWHDIHRI